MSKKEQEIVCKVTEHSKQKCHLCKTDLVKAQVLDGNKEVPKGSSILYCYKC